MSILMTNNQQYAEWITSISRKFRQYQLKAAVKVNCEMLKFYWEIGRDISNLSAQNTYGSDFYKNISSDLKQALPDVKSFSVTNLKYMRYFYEMYQSAANIKNKALENHQQPADEFILEKTPAQNHQQPADDFEHIFSIPWGHHIVIMNKCKDNPQKALFYVNKTLENNWSRAVLMNFLDTQLYERNGKAISNFAHTLPEIQSDLAQAITKDPYNFDFLSLRENYDEKELKHSLMNNLQNFLLELGRGFAFVGKEYRLEVGSTEQFIDMLFYNIGLHCYVVVEIKIRDFEPADMGQLSAYVAAVDGILKTNADNPTLGLLICKSKDNVLAQYSLNAINVPIGISEYELNELIKKQFKGNMPTIEEIEQELSENTTH